LSFAALQAGTADFACDDACREWLAGRWANWFGLPLGLLVAAASLAALIATFSGGEEPAPARQQRRLSLLAASSAVAGVLAVWCIATQLLARGSCGLCLASYASALVAAGATLWLSARSSGSGSDRRAGGVRRIVRAGAGAALLAASALALGQLTMPTSKPNAPVAAERQPAAKPKPPATSQPAADAGQPAAPAARLIGLHVGRFVLNAFEVPTWGSANAPYLGMALFDYTDADSRKARDVYERALSRYSGAFGIIALPAPLDSACNDQVERTQPANANACQYARLALAVWRARNDAFGKFDAFLFESEKPPPIERAQRRAEELVGKDALRAALDDSWITQQLQTNLAIQRANDEKSSDAGLPQLMLGRVIVRGRATTEALYPILDEFTLRKRR
jgi:uncharacterized membrane protein